MAYKPSFGAIVNAGQAKDLPSKKFRIALLGDWTGRANRGLLASSDEIAGMKPIKVNFDNLESVFSKLAIGLRIPVAGKTSVAELKFATYDDLHADAIFRQAPYLEDLTGFPRRLTKQPTYEKLAPKILQWAEAHGDLAFDPAPARASSIPLAASLEEYTTAEPKPTVPAKRQASEGMDVVHRILGPFVKRAIAGKSPDAKLIIDAASKASHEGMRQLLHHPDLAAFESNWRGLEWLLRRVIKGGVVDVALVDLSAQEFAADLSRTEKLEETGLYRLLIANTSEAVDGDPWSLLAGLYDFDVTATHADLLGRMSKIAARAHAPFVSSITPRLLDENYEIDPEIGAVWNELRTSSESGYLALALPKFLLRAPYGAKTAALESFEFEEFLAEQPTRYGCWGNPALAYACLLATGFMKAGGWDYRPGTDLMVEKLAMHVYRDADDEPVSLVTQTRFTAAVSTEVAKLGMSPLLAIRDRDAAQFGTLRSLNAKQDALRGRWGQSGGSPRTLDDRIETVKVGAAFGMPGDEEPAARSAASARSQPIADEDAPAGREDSSSPADEMDPELAALLGGGSAKPDDSTDAADDAMDPELAALLGGGQANDQPAANDSFEMDPELAALLGGGSDEPAASEPAVDDMDAELAALLAGGDESATAETEADDSDSDMDPELAALLAGTDSTEENSPEEEEEALDPELAALLAGMDSSEESPPEDEEEEMDPELAALLAGMDSSEESPPDEEDEKEVDDEMDPELAALLAGITSDEPASENTEDDKKDDDDDEDDGMDPELAALLRGE